MYKQHILGFAKVRLIYGFTVSREYRFFWRDEALRPSQQFFSHVGTFSWVEQVLSKEDEVSFAQPHK